MIAYYADHAATLYQGDVRECLRALPAESVQTVITSPPYWSLRDYGIAPSIWGGDAGHDHEWAAGPRGEGYTGTARWQHHDNGQGYIRINEEKRLRDAITRETRPEAWAQVQQGQFCACGAWCGALGLEPTPALFVDHMVEVFREVRRVLRKDGTCWVNLGDSYASGGGTGAGFNERYKDKAFATDKQAETDRQIPHVTRPPGLKPKDLVGIPWRVAFALQDDGWYLRQDIVWSKPNPMPESVTDRCTKAHEYVFLLAKSPRYFFDADAIREKASNESGWAKQRGSGVDTWQYNATPERAASAIHPVTSGSTPGDGAGRNKRSVWTVATDPFPEAHFATFPPALIAPMILAGTSERGACADCGAPWERVTETSADYAVLKAERSGYRHSDLESYGLTHGTSNPSLSRDSRTTGWRPTCAHDAETVGSVVLDPFVGSGTTAIEAKRLGRRAIGIDLNAEYLDMAVRGLQLNRRPDCVAQAVLDEQGVLL